MIKILVCGSRDYNDGAYSLVQVYRWLDTALEKYGRFIVIQGEAKGVDSAAKEWANARGLPCMSFPAEWNRHGKAAGHIRNGEMLEHGRPNLVFAFPGGVGTKNMIMQARKAGVTVFEVPLP